MTSIVSELKSALSDVPTVLLDDNVLHVLDDARAGVDALEVFAAQPSIVAVVGAGGSGKSSVVNAIVGADVVLASPVRPTTTDVTAIGASGPLPVEGATEYVVVDRLPFGLVVVDTPPWDVAIETVERIMANAALSIVVVTPSRYGDEATRELLAAAQTSDSYCVVANRMPQDLALREQVEDAIIERIGVDPAVVIAEGEPVVVADLVDEVPLDGAAEARRSVLIRAVFGASVRVAASLTEVAREVGSLERSIETVTTPAVDLTPIDASLEWTQVRGLLVMAAMSAVSTFDDAVESSHDGDLARRVRSLLPEADGQPINELLEEWKEEVCRRFRSTARLRFRKNSGRAILDRWSWVIAVDPSTNTPRRFNRLIRHDAGRTVSTCHQDLADILKRPVEDRRQEWMSIVDLAGEYRPGVLFAAATALGERGRDL